MRGIGENVTEASSMARSRSRRFLRLRTYLRAGWDETEFALLNRSIEKEPSDPKLWVLKALALKKAGNVHDASQAWRRAVALNPRNDDLVVLLAQLAREQQNDDDEIWALNQALFVRPKEHSLLTRLFTLRMRKGNMAEALVTAERLVELSPDCEPYLLRRAHCLIAVGRVDEAEAILGQLVASPAASDTTVSAWARFLVEHAGRPAEAAERLAIMAAQPGATWTVHLWLARTHVRSDHPIEAIAAFKRAAELAPFEATIWHELAVVQRHVGLAVDSQASFTRSLELEPNNPSALRIGGYEHTYQYGDAPFRRVTMALARVHRLETRSQVEVHYAVAKALEDVGEIDAAFEHYARAGDLQKRLTPWTELPSRRLLSVLQREFTPATHRDLRRDGYPSNKPVFIVGMPRSGTSLIEQIIASHPQARGAGEIKAADEVVNGLRIGRTTIVIGNSSALPHPQCDDEIASLSGRGRRYVDTIEAVGGREAMRLVDKRPGNFAWIGLLDAAIPGSYFIHSRRHPVDTCLSAYRLFFGDEVPFSYDLRDLGRQFRLYHAFMAYWSRLLPANRLLHIRHEDLTADLEGEVRRILAFIGLPWSDACLDFFKNHRVVRTASAIQVRRPIYRNPVNRWRNYERYLGPLLDELGDLVTDYERELRDQGRIDQVMDLGEAASGAPRASGDRLGNHQ
jgi:Flp pilus assembly protein TadD